MIRLIPSILAFSVLAAAADAETEREIDVSCLGNAVEACYVVLDGPIDDQMVKGFEALRSEWSGGIEAASIYLDSPGGDLGAALRLGRLVRETGLRTMLGARVPQDRQFEAFPSGGRCDSACAYVFMGGEKRQLREGDVLGLHRFWSAGGQIDGDSAQVISGQLVNYMVEMGIDPRVFRLAAEKGQDEMYHIGPDEAVEYDLVTPSGYGPFFMEPWANGVVASSKRLDPTGPYDLARQVTFYCKERTAFALITSEGMALDREPADGLPALRFDGVEMNGGPASVRSSEALDYITFSLPPVAATALSGSTEAALAVYWPRVMGWRRGMALQLSDMDRAMIASAFTHCID